MLPHHTSSNNGAPATIVEVYHSGLGSTGAWSVSIDGQQLRGCEADRDAVHHALWNVPEAGATAIVADCGAIWVPHQAAGRVAAMTLAGLEMVPGGDRVTLTVRDGDDPLEP